MQINLLAGGEDTAAPLTLFQDHPRLSSRPPHAASTQRKTFNWVINYITNKSPSWFFFPSLFLFFPLFFCLKQLLVVWWMHAGVQLEGRETVLWLHPQRFNSPSAFCLLNFTDWALSKARVSWTASWLCRVHFSSYGPLHTWEGKRKFSSSSPVTTLTVIFSTTTKKSPIKCKNMAIKLVWKPKTACPTFF